MVSLSDALANFTTSECIHLEYAGTFQTPCKFRDRSLILFSWSSAGTSAGFSPSPKVPQGASCYPQNAAVAVWLSLPLQQLNSLRLVCQSFPFASNESDFHPKTYFPLGEIAVATLVGPI